MTIADCEVDSALAIREGTKADNAFGSSIVCAKPSNAIVGDVGNLESVGS